MINNSTVYRNTCFKLAGLVYNHRALNARVVITWYMLEMGKQQYAKIVMLYDNITIL